MKKKVMALLIVFILLFSSYAFAYTYDRNGGTTLWNSEQSTYITQDTRLEEGDDAESVGMRNRRVQYLVNPDNPGKQWDSIDEQGMYKSNRIGAYWIRKSI